MDELPYAVNAQNQIYISAPAKDVTTAENIYAALGIKYGDMITFVTIKGESSLISGIFTYTPNQLSIIRLKADKVGTVATPHDAFSVESNIAGLDINVTATNDTLTLTTNECNFGTAILSRESNGMWLRSNSHFVGNRQILNGVCVGNQFSTYPTGDALILNGAKMQSKPVITTLPAPQLKLAAKSVSISTKGGKVAAPTLTGAPDGATITYSTSNATIAKVDANTGEVTAVGNGTAVINVAVGPTEKTSAAAITFSAVVTGQDNSGTQGSGSSSGDLGGEDNEL